jgi:elongation factor 2 kinase
MAISSETRSNLSKVHYQLAVLHGLGRFPEVVPTRPDDNPLETPPHDAFSVLYHLAHAASMHNVAACLALGRLHAGLGTCVSPLLDTIVPIDFDTAKDLLRRAMDSPFPPTGPKAAAGCLLYQIYLDESENDDLEAEKASDTTIMHLIEDILKLMAESKGEEEDLDRHKKLEVKGKRKFQTGDRVKGNYGLEGSYYPGVVESVSEDGGEVVVKYDDDGSTENLTTEHVRLIIPPTATQTALGGPLSDEEALGLQNTDEKFIVETYELKAELAELKEKVGDKQAAAELYEEASNDAMTANKMKKATEWSLKASELLE